MKLQLIAGLLLASSEAYAAAIDTPPAAELDRRGESGGRRPFFDLWNWRQGKHCEDPEQFEGSIEVDGEDRQFGDFEAFQREWDGRRKGSLRHFLPWLFPDSCTTAGSEATPTLPELVEGKHKPAPTQRPSDASGEIGLDGSTGTLGVPESGVGDDAGVTVTPDSNSGTPSSSTSTDLVAPTFPTAQSSSSGEASLLVASSTEPLFSSSADPLAPPSSVGSSLLVASSADALVSTSSSADPAPTSEVLPATSSEGVLTSEGVQLSTGSLTTIDPTNSEIIVPSSADSVPSSSQIDPLNNTSALPTSSEIAPNVTISSSVIPTGNVVDPSNATDIVTSDGLPNVTGVLPTSSGIVPNVTDVVTSSTGILPNATAVGPTTLPNVTDITSGLPNATHVPTGIVNATVVPTTGQNGTLLPTATMNGTAVPTNGTILPTGNATVLPTVTIINGTSVPTNISVIATVTSINGTTVPTFVLPNGTALPTNTTVAPPAPTIRNNSGSIDNPSVVEGIDKIRGVNLGGWLVYEGWITADGGGFGSGKNWVDEWTMAETYDLNRDYINAHWRGWVTETDFAEIAAAGLNTVRIPVGYWTFIPTADGEPYRGQVETWTMLQKAFGWAKTHGLRIMIDMHAVPGPQSLDAHSGHKTDKARFFFSERNKERTIAALLAAAREFTQPKYGGVLKSLMLVNEPRLPDEEKDLARAWLKQFYLDAHTAVRALPEPYAQNVTVLIHDSFDGAERYGDFKAVTGDANVAMDRHLYSIFEPSKANWTGAAVLQAQCQQAGDLVNFAKKYFTVMVAEFGAPARGGSCSWFEGVEGVQNPGQCPGWGDEPDRILWVKDSLLTQIEAYERTAGWVFWTWKTANGDLGWDMRRIIDKVLKQTLGVNRFDEIKLDRCAYYNATMPPLP